MAICEFCKQEMTTADSCIEVPVRIVGAELKQTPYGEETKGPDGTSYIDYSPRCHDCGVAPGGFHHPGCDVERCPRCDGQLIGNHCLDADPRA